TFDLYQRAMASTRRVMELLKTQQRLPDGDRSLDPQHVDGEYQFNDVDFSYQSGGLVLQNLNMTIHAGQTVGIVGATGAGKSSLIKLLMRFYDVSSGQILLDGHDLRSYKLSDLTEAVGL